MSVAFFAHEGDERSPGGQGDGGDVGYESEDSDSSEGSDGFWSGNLVEEWKHPLSEGEQGGQLMGLAGAPEGWRYKDARIRTFAWWQVALARSQRKRSSLDPGYVEEESDEWEGAPSFRPCKRRRIGEVMSDRVDDLLATLF